MRRSVLIAGIAAWIVLSAFSDHSAGAPTPQAVTADGGRYYGALVDGKFHGQGRIEWDNGTYYEGEFARGLYSGRGRRRLADGDIYEGDFRNGGMEGTGRLQGADGTTYVGQFRKDTFNGRGLYRSPIGERYEGAFKDGYFHGRGKFVDGSTRYDGEFRQGRYSGQGEASYSDGTKYRGAFAHGQFHGAGRLEQSSGDVYEGKFEKNGFVEGTHSYPKGGHAKGQFANWRLKGKGSVTDSRGDRYEGEFVDGVLEGRGRLTGKNGGTYEGEFRQWRFHGAGVLRLPNGDIYTGQFARGVYEGDGTLVYASPRGDGRTQDSGIWRYGFLFDAAKDRQAKVDTETALYSQRVLLDAALASLQPRDPSKINMYLLAIAGDGTQEVFRREVEFVRHQFSEKFGTTGRSVALINSRSTLRTVPMATITSIGDAVKAIAARMNRDEDILFLFLTSHGSKEHEVTLSQSDISLRGLSAAQLADLLVASGIRWKVVVVSACYSGGFVDALRNEHTLILTAARHDRQSFGCADDNDFTYFGRAFFKEALPDSGSFREAFEKAEKLIKEWEIKELSARSKQVDDELSLPQMWSTEAIDRHLRRWWDQLNR